MISLVVFAALYIAEVSVALSSVQTKLTASTSWTSATSEPGYLSSLDHLCGPSDSSPSNTLGKTAITVMEGIAHAVKHSQRRSFEPAY